MAPDHCRPHSCSARQPRGVAIGNTGPSHQTSAEPPGWGCSPFRRLRQTTSGSECHALLADLRKPPTQAIRWAAFITLSIAERALTPSERRTITYVGGVTIS